MIYWNMVYLCLDIVDNLMNVISKKSEESYLKRIARSLRSLVMAYEL